MKKDLYEKLSKLGFNVFEKEDTPDDNETLLEVLRSGDIRLLEGFPILLANINEKGMFDYPKLKALLKDQQEKKILNKMILISLVLYKLKNRKYYWTKKLLDTLQIKTKKEFKIIEELFIRKGKIDIGKLALTSERMGKIFDNYSFRSQSELKTLISTRDELGLEYALSQIFSPKQKDIFVKKIKREKLTKTEREYFSRVIKRKILALSNEQLHILAKEIIQAS